MTPSPAVSGVSPHVRALVQSIGDEWLVADHPGIMPGRDLVDGLLPDVELLARVGHDVQGTRHGIADVVELAGRCPGDGRHVRRPPPARLVDGVADDRFIEPQDAGMAVREVANLRGRLDAPGLQTRHGHPSVATLHHKSSGVT